MVFYIERVEPEVRKDFKIRGMMKRVWLVQLKILSYIDAICKKHGLSYFADFGTMLGAVREGGYIPWDDDLDIGMLRADFEKFKVYAQTELPKGYSCINSRDGEMDDIVFCIRNTIPICLEEDFLKENYGCPYSVGVDIFIYDNVADDESERELQISLFSYAFTAGKNLDMKSTFEMIDPELREIVSDTEKLTGVSLDKESALKPQLMKLADQIAAMYMWDETREAAVIAYAVNRKHYIVNRRWLSDTTEMQFENIMIPVPIEYAKVLERWFGADYMEPRIWTGHNYPYFKKQEEELFSYMESNGVDIPEYLKE